MSLHASVSSRLGLVPGKGAAVTEERHTTYRQIGRDGKWDIICLCVFVCVLRGNGGLFRKFLFFFHNTSRCVQERNDDEKSLYKDAITKLSLATSSLLLRLTFRRRGVISYSRWICYAKVISKAKADPIEHAELSMLRAQFLRLLNKKIYVSPQKCVTNNKVSWWLFYIFIYFFLGSARDRLHMKI